jgi:hypothetical protein
MVRAALNDIAGMTCGHENPDRRGSQHQVDGRYGRLFKSDEVKDVSVVTYLSRSFHEIDGEALYPCC